MYQPKQNAFFVRATFFLVFSFESPAFFSLNACMEDWVGDEAFLCLPSLTVFHDASYPVDLLRSRPQPAPFRPASL